MSIKSIIGGVRKMTKIKRAIFVAAPAILILSALVLSTGIGIAESPEEVQGLLRELETQSQDLVNVTKTIHDNTEQIADDESLDEEIRAQAEAIHVASHDLWHLAEDVCQHVVELKDLCSDPQMNKMEINESLDEIIEHLEEYTSIQEDNEDSVHSILFAVPESHKEYADETHNAFHEAEDIISDLVEGIKELAATIGVEVKATE
jgi:predicted  nucleic acid-binding Zn-ribbon protein